MNFQMQCCDLLNRFKNSKDRIIYTEELKDQESWNLKKSRKREKAFCFYLNLIVWIVVLLEFMYRRSNKILILI